MAIIETVERVSVPQVMDNGAKVVAFVPTEPDGRRGIVLCEWRSHDPYVTWQAYYNTRGEWVAEVGHYCSNYAKGYADFIERVTRGY